MIPFTMRAISAIKHSLAFVLSPKTDLARFLPEYPLRIDDHRDRICFDVSGLRRGLHFIRLRFECEPALVGPRLLRGGNSGETSGEVFVFESRGGGEIFGTVLIAPGDHTLRFYPSRLESRVRFTGAAIRPITEFARENFYGIAYVQWRVFGGPWVIRRLFKDLSEYVHGWFSPVASAGYAAWWRAHGRCSSTELERQRESADGLALSPLISIILPTYRPDLQLFEQAVDSVRNQTYKNWQLCICDDGSADPVLSEYLRRLETSDPRIATVTRVKNGHISAASNGAIALAEGEYIGFLDHDDKLAPNALYEIASALANNQELRVLYSDEDVIGESGQPLSGHFKPDWNYDLARSINYVCHFLVVQRDLLRQVGGFRESFEGAQDFDLLLRLTEGLPRDQIHHIPRVLYHWRAAAGSTARHVDNKPYAARAGKAALAEHIKRTGLDAVAEHSEIATAYRIRYRLPDPAPSVSIIIPTRDHIRVLRNCVRSLFEMTDYPEFEVVVVDNGSDEPECLDYLVALEKRDRVRVLRYGAPFNFSAINNFAVSHCLSDVLVLLNNDTEVLNTDWLTEMVSQAIRPEVGAVGSKLLYANDRIQHAGVLLGLGGDGIAGHAFKGRHRDEVGPQARTRLVQEYCAVTGACLAVARKKYLQVGGLDEDNLPVAYNDIDFCLRLGQAGYHNVWTPYAQLYHYESYSRGPDSTSQNLDRYQAEAEYMRRRWGAILNHDPNYNPNFTRGLYNFELAWPPYTVN